MATAPPIQGPKIFLHVRGTWSARDDRTPSAVWLAILWLGITVGFGLTSIASMILTTVAICGPGFARAPGYLLPYQPHSAVVWFFLHVLRKCSSGSQMPGWDLWAAA